MAKIDNIQEVSLDLLRPYPNNAKIHGEEQIKMISDSIKEFGFISPCLIDRDYNIIAGHGRVQAAKNLGMQSVPCVFVEGLTEAQRKAYILADNRLTELGEWDFNKINLELEDLSSMDFDVSLTGFDFLNDEPDIEVYEDTFTENVEPLAKPGDIFQLGRHRLMCGDSTDFGCVKKLINGNTIDMLFTDPPYNVAFNGRSGKFDVITNDDLPPEEFENFICKVIEIIKQINPTNYYIWCNWKFYGVLQKNLDYKNCIVWCKNVFGLGVGYRHQHEFCLFNGKIDDSITNESDLWEVKKDINYLHPTQKPVELCARALRNHHDANNVLDLFGGSGTTLIGCEQMGRNCFMMEIDPHYVDVIINRWEQLTNDKAVLIND